MMIQLRLRLLFVVLIGLASCSGKNCNIKDPCKCEFDDGSGAVDLTSLGNTDGTPKFKDVPGKSDGNLYSYNPCGGFEEERGCMDAAVCMLSKDKREIQQLGAARGTMFKYDEESGHVLAGYISRGIALQVTEIEMICDEHACQPEFVAIGRSSGQAAYKMQLKSICACAGKCSASGPDKCSASTSGAGGGGISVGSILLIGLLACAVFYLVIGVAYMKVRKSATGTELIPNKDLWKSLPGLVAGGFKFLFSKCTSRGGGYTSTN